MTTFNSNFYQPNTKYTREDAEARLISLGYKNFSFKSASYSNGCSFYFIGEDGKEIRVSDHPLTGKRAFETVQISMVDVKILKVEVKKDDTKEKIKFYKGLLKKGKISEETFNKWVSELK